jgi:hypothetical protein
MSMVTLDTYITVPIPPYQGTLTEGEGSEQF